MSDSLILSQIGKNSGTRSGRNENLQIFVLIKLLLMSYKKIIPGILLLTGLYSLPGFTITGTYMLQ